MTIQMAETWRGSNPCMQDYEILSRRGIELAFRLRQFKENNGLSWQQVANIASVYGKWHDTKFYQANLSSYALFKKIPSKAQMDALLDMMDITIEDL